MTLLPDEPYPRDMIGFGANPPHAAWPNHARIAVQFVLNYEEGAENNVLHGDAGSEQFLSEMFNPPAFSNRHLSMESIYEYGSRAGVWRILKAFQQRQLPMTIFGVGMALARHPELAAKFQDLGHEVAAHGWRWISYQNADETTERAHLQQCIATFKHLYGAAPQGWYTGRDSPNTRRILLEEYARAGDTISYDSDYYGDDLPFWQQVTLTDGQQTPHLVVPYTLDSNDMRFALPNGFATGDDFYSYLKDAFDVLYAEGETAPKMLSIGLHCRIIGRPGRFRALERFLDYVQSHSHVWICRRLDIAEHWRTHHPYNPVNVAR